MYYEGTWHTEAVSNQWGGSTFWGRKKPCKPLALFQRAAFTTRMSGSCFARISGEVCGVHLS